MYTEYHGCVQGIFWLQVILVRDGIPQLFRTVSLAVGTISNQVLAMFSPIEMRCFLQPVLLPQATGLQGNEPVREHQHHGSMRHLKMFLLFLSH